MGGRGRRMGKEEGGWGRGMGIGWDGTVNVKDSEKAQRERVRKSFSRLFVKKG